MPEPYNKYIHVLIYVIKRFRVIWGEWVSFSGALHASLCVCIVLHILFQVRMQVEMVKKKKKYIYKRKKGKKKEKKGNIFIKEREIKT